MLNIPVILIAMADLNMHDLEYLAKQLKAKFGNCTVGEIMDMPDAAYSPVRGQYMAGLVLQKLQEAYPETRLLGATDADLYYPGMSFVYGQAQGRCAVMSLKRLSGDVDMFHTLMVKVAVHELGHTMGLAHCLHELCVMRFRDIDKKQAWFCKPCAARLERENR